MMITNLTHNLANTHTFETKKKTVKRITRGPAENFIKQRCPSCVTTWVDYACGVAGVKMTDLERCRLIEALLAHRHLIISGPADIGKRRLAHSLALSMAQGQQRYVRLIQGHPWWATGTGDLAHYVNLQMEYSVWRLFDFVETISDDARLSTRMRTGQNVGTYVACIERMSQVEIDFYYGAFSQSLLRNGQDEAGAASLRLIGTYDGRTPPDLDHRMLRMASGVHLSNMRAS